MKDNGGMWSCRAGTEQKFRDQLCHMLEGGGVSRRWARCHRFTARLACADQDFETAARGNANT